MTTNFQWFVQGSAEMPPLNFPLVERWVRAVAESRGRICGPLTYVFCDDERILEVNRQFLSHDYYTDIITFDDCRGKLLRGDMFISLDTVASNAALQGVSARQELLRVIIHGILHLCGINDKGPGEREIMESAENQSLALLKAIAKEEGSQPFAAREAAPESEAGFMESAREDADRELRRTERDSDREVWDTARTARRGLEDTEKHF